MATANILFPTYLAEDLHKMNNIDAIGDDFATVIPPLHHDPDADADSMMMRPPQIRCDLQERR